MYLQVELKMLDNISDSTRICCVQSNESVMTNEAKVRLG